VIDGLDTAEVAPGVTVIPVPGHTKGSVVYLVDDRWLFTGDTLAWSHRREDLVAFRGACWYSWSELTTSLGRLADLATFEWVLPGHGPRVHLPAEEATRRLRALVARMPAAA
jgi:glyoxylase-like metal-dependent hydrolase (beta-lactamase superfamily II)